MPLYHAQNNACTNGGKRFMKHQIIQLTITMFFGEIENTVHPILLCDEKNRILIDCGYIGALPEIEKELSRNGLAVKQLTGLVLTHHDHDHMGAAAALKRANPNMKIYASPKEAVFISAKEKPFRLCQAEEMQESLPPEQQAFGKAFCDMLRRVEAVGVDYELSDGERFDWCGGCQILFTPGHTQGHISLYLEESNSIVTGDAMALEGAVPVLANPQFAFDPVLAEQSVQQLLDKKADGYYCYHGGRYVLPPL